MKITTPIIISIVGLLLFIAGTVGTSENSPFLEYAERLSMIGLGAFLTSLTWLICTLAFNKKELKD